MGLAMVYGLVRQIGGTIEVLSAPGRGTTFTIALPPAEAAEAPRAAPPAERAGGPAPALTTVLLADDEPAVRGLAASALSSQGYRVLEAGGGDEALALAARHPGPIHLLVTDVVMPGTDGPALARRLRAARPGTPVLFISGFAEQAMLAAELEATGGSFLAKPFAIADLARAARELLGRS
jgi:CheY-like chemotaxis protein